MLEQLQCANLSLLELYCCCSYEHELRRGKCWVLLDVITHGRATTREARTPPYNDSTAHVIMLVTYEA